MTLEQAASHYGLSRVKPLGSGLINQTYAAHKNGDKVVLQCVNSIFAPSIHDNIAAVTAHLKQHGFVTAELIPSPTGSLYHETPDQQIWRCMTYIDGTCFDRVPSPAAARSATKLIARFHQILSDLDWQYKGTRDNVHDTKHYVKRLEQIATHRPAVPEDLVSQTHNLTDELLEETAGLQDLWQLPKRHCHGDLKISNIIFDESGTHPRTLVDLDTLGQLPIAYEMGDALRSWCNQAGEDCETPSPSQAIVDTVLSTYIEETKEWLTDEEHASIIPGFRTICLELACRFCLDIYEDSYFGWSQERFASRRHHNLTRARGQLALYRWAQSYPPNT